jgi:acyl carrier protein
MKPSTAVATLAALLQEIRPEHDFTASRDFIGEGLLDSFDMITLVATLDKAYGISIAGVDILPEHFRNLDSIAALLRKYAVAP